MPLVQGWKVVRYRTASGHAAEFVELLEGLRLDLSPDGKLEEILVEKIAVCCWRQKRALRCEAGLIKRAYVPDTGLKQLTESLGLKPNLELRASVGPIIQRSIIWHLEEQLPMDLNISAKFEKLRNETNNCFVFSDGNGLGLRA